MGNDNNYTDDEVYILVDEDGNEVFLDDDLETEEPVVYEDAPAEGGDTILYNKYDLEAALSEDVGEVGMEEEYELEEPSYDTGFMDFDEKEELDDDEPEGGLGNKLILLFGALIIVLAVAFLGIFYFTRKAPKVKNTDFSDIGTEIASIGVIGEDNIAAITAAEGLRIDALNEAQKSYDYEEADQEGGVSTVNVTLTSIVKDLKIKMVNSKGKLIGNVPFVVEVTSPDGKTEKWEDDNKDGIIYKSDIAGGIYKVKIVPLNGYDSMYDFSSASIQSITVKTQLDYQKVDVKNEIKKSSQVDAAEDGADNDTEVESVLKDTVAYVVSAKVPSSEGFKAISKDTIKDPMKILAEKNEASIGRFMRLSDNDKTGDISGGEGGDTSQNNPEPPAHTHTLGEFKSDGNGNHVRKCSDPNCPKPDEILETEKCETKKKLTDKVGTIDNPYHEYECSVCHYKWTEKCEDKNGDNKCDTCGGTISKTEGTVSYSANTVNLSFAKENERTANVKVTAKRTPDAEVESYTWESDDAKEEIVKLENKTSQEVKLTAVKPGEVKVKCKVKFKGDTNTYEGAWIVVKVSAGVTVTLDRTAKKAIFVDGDKFTVTATIKGGKTGKVTWAVEDANKDKVKLENSIAGKDGDAERKANCVVTGLKPGTVTLTCTSEDDKNIKQTITIVVLANPKTDKTTKLVDNNGKQVYIYDKSSKKYVEATYADYYSGTDLFTPVDVTYIYTGWWTIDGKTYYFDANGNKVTGDQVILGAKYSFDSNGVLKGGTGLFGIDVSTWNGTIDWNQVAKSGVSYAIIRCGYRGTTQGGLIEDNKFATNAKNATAAGIRIGVYFFTQAISEAEAVEEASMCLSMVEGYKLTYPIFIDVESGSGNARANGLSKESRTAIVKAFCKTISNSGYKAGIYANKNWLTNKLNTSELTGYTIWLAQYASAPSYTATRYDLWQYSSQGSIKGISGNVDLDLNYLGY